MVFLTSTLYHLNDLKVIDKVILVITSTDFNEQQYFQGNKVTYDKICIDPMVENPQQLNEDDLHKIYQKLEGCQQSMQFFGNMGIGLAWSYFYGYLNLILPDMENRILKSDKYKIYENKMSKKFFIVIPESGNTPADRKSVV